MNDAELLTMLANTIALSDDPNMTKVLNDLLAHTKERALRAAAPDLLAACEMGGRIEDGPGLLRLAADYLSEHLLEVTAGHLYAKADAEEAAIKKARGE